MSIRLIAFSRLVVVMGLAVWLSIAVINNLTDPGTNRLLLGHTISMDLIHTEDILGAGLIWRAWPAQWSTALLYLVVSIQITCSAFLWWAGLSYTKALLLNDPHLLALARNRAFLALSLFVLLWMFFICGGLWFAYWLKQGAIQAVHMTLILIGIGALLFVEVQPRPELPSMSNDFSETGNPPPNHQNSLAITGDQS